MRRERKEYSPELVELMKQKREIEEKIKALKADFIIGNSKAKFETKKDNVGKAVWQINIIYKNIRYEWNKNTLRYEEATKKHHEQWNPIVREYSKEDAIKRLNEILKDLFSLKEQIEKRNEENKEEIHEQEAGGQE